MNISPLTVYFWQLSDKLCDIAQGLAIAMSVICFLVGIIALVSRDDTICDNEKTQEAILKWAKRLPFGAVALWVFFAFIPSSKTIAMMVIIPKIADSKAVQQDLPEIYDLAIKALKEQLTPKK